MWSDTNLHAEHSFAVALQRSQQQAILSISNADGGVIRADQQDTSSPFLSRRQATDSPRAVALEHIQLLIVLQEMREKWFTPQSEDSISFQLIKNVAYFSPNPEFWFIKYLIPLDWRWSQSHWQDRHREFSTDYEDKALDLGDTAVPRMLLSEKNKQKSL